MIGAMVGWPAVLASFFSSYVLGFALVVALMAAKRKKLTDTLPMGPLLVAGAVAVLFIPLHFFPLFWYPL